MQIIVDDLRAYVLVCLMLCGELDKQIFLDSTESAVYGRRAVSSLRDGAKLISEKRIGERKMLRLRKPAAWMIMQYLPEVEQHYNMLTNNHQFKTEPQTSVVRAIQKGLLVFTAIQNDLSVNYIKLTYQKSRGRRKRGSIPYDNLLEVMNQKLDQQKHIEKDHVFYDIVRHIWIDCTRVPAVRTGTYGNIVDHMLPNDNYLFLSQEVKSYRDSDNKKNSPTLAINSSRSFGHIVGGYNSYAVYIVSEEMPKMQREVEGRYRDYLESIFQRIYGAVSRNERDARSPRGECILFCRSFTDITKYIRYPGKRYRGTNLATTVCDIYSHCYLVPVAYKTILSRITASGWREKLLSQLFSEDEINAVDKQLREYCDAVISETPAIELISMDIRKIELVLVLLSKSKNVQFILCCETWQEEIIKSIFQSYASQVEMRVHTPD